MRTEIATHDGRSLKQLTSSSAHQNTESIPTRKHFEAVIICFTRRITVKICEFSTIS